MAENSPNPVIPDVCNVTSQEVRFLMVSAIRERSADYQRSTTKRRMLW